VPWRLRGREFPEIDAVADPPAMPGRPMPSASASARSPVLWVRSVSVIRPERLLDEQRRNAHTAGLVLAESGTRARVDEHGTPASHAATRPIAPGTEQCV
jgi:hypothetical protein